MKEISLVEILIESRFKENYSLINDEDREILDRQFTSFFDKDHVIAGMKLLVDKILDLAAENADYLVISEPGSEGIVYKVDVNKNSILQIKD